MIDGQAEWLPRLKTAAFEASFRAYAPYSSFRVGAAVVDCAGNVFAGCNIENASYGLTICAERVAVFGAIAAGASQIVGVCVYADTSLPISPCGACRQVLMEFCSDAGVFLTWRDGSAAAGIVNDLLPFAFVGVMLKDKIVPSS